MNIWAALGTNVAVAIAVMIILWLVSVKIRDVSFIDAFWPVGMVLMALVSMLQLPAHNGYAILLFSLVAIWGLRLGTHLFLRWREEGEDPRYKKIMGKATQKQGMSWPVAALVKVWALQIPLLFIVSLCAQLGILYSPDESIGLLAVAGAALSIFGTLFETAGDAQLKSFKQRRSSDEEVLDTGLWRYTRHPNYFGDFCAWWGIWLVSLQIGWPAWVAIIGPLFLSFTLMKWSGAPLLEGGMKKKKPKYADYIERTNAFFPGPPKKG